MKLSPIYVLKTVSAVINISAKQEVPCILTVSLTVISVVVPRLIVIVFVRSLSIVVIALVVILAVLLIRFVVIIIVLGVAWIFVGLRLISLIVVSFFIYPHRRFRSFLR